MPSDRCTRQDVVSGRLERVGEGYAVEAGHLYVWEETLVEAHARGVELGLLPARSASPRPHPRADGRQASAS